MPAFKRFLVCDGDLFYVEGTYTEGEGNGLPITFRYPDTLSAYRVSLAPAAVAASGTQWLISHPPVLELQSCYIGELAKKKLLLDILNDATREKILNAGTNA